VRIDTDRVRQALGSAAAIGPYFAVELDADGPAWLDYPVLIADRAALPGRVRAAREFLAERCRTEPDAIDERATASIQFLGIAARLISPAYAAAVVAGVVPRLRPSLLRWQDTLGGPMPIALMPAGGFTSAEPARLARLLYAEIIDTAVLPLLETVGARFRLSEQVLWGNVASAVGGASIMLATARPDLAEHARAVAAALVDCRELAGRGGFVDMANRQPPWRFARDNCCLFYRIPGGGKCADCVLVPAQAHETD